MSESKLAIIDTSTFVLSLNVDKGDITAIAVSEIESRLIAKRKSLKTIADKLRKDTKDVEDETAKLLKEEAGKHSADRRAILSTAFTAAGIDLRTEINDVSIQTEDGKPDIIGYQLRLLSPLRESSRYSASVFSVGCSLPLTPDIIKLQEQYALLKTQIVENNNLLVDVMEALSNLPSLERRARASIATRALRDMDKGAEILDALASLQEDPELKLLIG